MGNTNGQLTNTLNIIFVSTLKAKKKTIETRLISKVKYYISGF